MCESPTFPVLQSLHLGPSDLLHRDIKRTRRKTFRGVSGIDKCSVHGTVVATYFMAVIPLRKAGTKDLQGREALGDSKVNSLGFPQVLGVPTDLWLSGNCPT